MTRTATPVNFTLDLNGRSGPRSSQVAHALIDAIARGQVHDGDRLPSTRTRAATFGLARAAVVAAYEELTAAGFLIARPGGSTYVERGAGDAARAGAFGPVLSGASGAGLPHPAPSAYSGPRPATPGRIGKNEPSRMTSPCCEIRSLASCGRVSRKCRPAVTATTRLRLGTT